MAFGNKPINFVDPSGLRRQGDGWKNSDFANKNNPPNGRGRMNSFQHGAGSANSAASGVAGLPGLINGVLDFCVNCGFIDPPNSPTLEFNGVENLFPPDAYYDNFEPRPPKPGEPGFPRPGDPNFVGPVKPE